MADNAAGEPQAPKRAARTVYRHKEKRRKHREHFNHLHESSCSSLGSSHDSPNESHDLNDQSLTSSSDVLSESVVSSGAGGESQSINEDGASVNEISDDGSSPSESRYSGTDEAENELNVAHGDPAAEVRGAASPGLYQDIGAVPQDEAIQWRLPHQVPVVAPDSPASGEGGMLHYPENDDPVIYDDDDVLHKVDLGDQHDIIHRQYAVPQQNQAQAALEDIHLAAAPANCEVLDPPALLAAAAVQVENEDMGIEAEEDFQDANSDIDDYGSENAWERETDSESDNDSDIEVDANEGSESEAGDSNGGSDNDDDDDDDVQGDIPLYPGGPLSLKESLLSIFTPGLRHHLTGTCLADIMQLIALHCMPNNICKTTLFKFKKFFKRIGSGFLIYHFFCSGCIYPLQEKNSICPKCNGVNSVTYFIELPLLSQLQSMFKRHDFLQDLQFRTQRIKKVPANLEDIYDGRLYREQIESGYFEGGGIKLTLMWYTDGVALFKSSKFSIWPLFFVINELSYKKRTLKENIIFAGIWFGEFKPNPNVFLRPFKKVLDTFSNTGFNLRVPEVGQINVKGRLLCGTCDLPAKSKFMGFKQFNSYYGCAHCLSEGERFHLENNSSVQVFPYTPNMALRTHAEVEHFARQAVRDREQNRNASVYGVKHLSLLYYMVPDLIRGTAIDCMHGVYLSCAKLLLFLWFDSSLPHSPWSLASLMDVVDRKLRNIKPPSYAQRAPRSIKNYLAFWKALEYKLWLLYYSVPVLEGVMDQIYLEYHCKLVSAIYLLSQESVSQAQVATASGLLHAYVADFARLYSLRYIGMNVHQLLHLPDVVLNLGPLWVYSCFFWENLNGQITKLVHGTQHVALQICSAASPLLNLPVHIQRLAPGSSAGKFCIQMTSNEKCVKVADVIEAGIYAVGLYKTNNAVQLQHSRIIMQNTMGIQGGQLQLFFKLRMVVSQEYSRISQRKESSYVCFSHNNVPRLGRVIRFVKWTACNVNCDAACQNCQVTFICIVRICDRQLWIAHRLPAVRISHIACVTPSDNVVAIPHESLESVCYYMKIGPQEFICRPVNCLETE